MTDAINAKGYGLTFGLHTRIDDRVEEIVSAVKVGNIYVNRNQIGAVVGSQPFGGEGLSGTGPKAGGTRTVARLGAGKVLARLAADTGARAELARLQQALGRIVPERGARSVLDLVGPTGESNRLSEHPRGTIICAGPTLGRAMAQADAARAFGNAVLVVAPGATGEGGPHRAEIDGVLDPTDLTALEGFDGVLYEGDPGPVRQALAAREGPILPLFAIDDDMVTERHFCIDTSAAGGNAQLLSSTEDEADAA